MKKYLSILFLLQIQVIFAQTITHVFWTEQTSMSASENIYYKSDVKLNWQNFKGTPPPPSSVAAITSSGFGYKGNIETLGKLSTINIAVYCYFNKNKSWVRPTKTTNYILNHEQRHFDASYLAASIFMQKLKNTAITVANFNSVVPQIYKECCAILNTLQHTYDSETMNGQIADKQEKWNKYFNENIILLKNNN